MSFFADLTPHTYTKTDGLHLLNVGWLDIAYPYKKGVVSGDFVKVLAELCTRPMHLHRGYQECQFCWEERPNVAEAARGNGQIRVLGTADIWYSAQVMIHHYVSVHGYQPPDKFVDAVLQQRSEN